MTIDNHFFNLRINFELDELNPKNIGVLNFFSMSIVVLIFLNSQD